MLTSGFERQAQLLPDATNLFLEKVPGPRIASAYLKLTVPRTSLTNFLVLSGLNGFNGEFLPIPAGTIPRLMPLPSGLDFGSMASWFSEMRHSEKWDPYKANIPLRMICFKTSAKSSPGEEVFMVVLVDDSISTQAKVYLEYHRLAKRR